jgi:hypothetical protein
MPWVALGIQWGCGHRSWEAFIVSSYNVALASRDCNNETSANLTPWLSPASKLYQLSNHSLSAKLVPTFAVSECCVVSATDPYSCILDFIDWSRYYFFQIAPQLCSQGWVDPVPDPLLLRTSGSSRNQAWGLRICSQELWPLDHRGCQQWDIAYAVLIC